MAAKMDLVTAKFNCHHWMMEKMDLIATIRFGQHCQVVTKKGGNLTNPHSICFGRPQGWAIKKNMVNIQSSQIFRWRMKVFSC
jgi:hypothetical protein